MHFERDGSPAFVFDLMEPERPKVDRAVVAFPKLEALHPADFTVREDPELASRVAQVSMQPGDLQISLWCIGRLIGK
jgi:CRISPR-associated protein Cas1